MPATPANIINTDLAIGGNFGAVGNIVTAGGVGASDEFVSYTGLRIASGTPGNPTNGDLTIKIVEQLVTLNTSGATTKVTLPAGSIPLESAFVGATLRINADVLGADSTTLTLSVNPLSGPNALLILSAPLTTGATTRQVFPGIFPVQVAADGVDSFDLVLSGGGDNIPSSGTVRVVLYVATIGALTA